MKKKVKSYVIKNAIATFSNKGSNGNKLSHGEAENNSISTRKSSESKLLKLISPVDEQKELADKKELSTLKIILIENTEIDKDIIKGGSLKQLKLFRDLVDKIELIHKNEIMLRAIEDNQINIVKFLVNNYQLKLDQDFVRIAAENENLDMLKYLIEEKGLYADEDALIASIEYQNIEIFDWLTEVKGMPLDVSGATLTLHTAPNPKFIKLCFQKNPFIEIDYSEVEPNVNLNSPNKELSTIIPVIIEDVSEQLLGQIQDFSLDTAQS